MSSDLTVTKASIPAASRNLNHLIRHLGERKRTPALADDRRVGGARRSSWRH